MAVLRWCFFVYIACFSVVFARQLPALGVAQSDLVLVAEWGSKEYPVREFRPLGVVVETPDGEVKALPDGYQLKLKGSATPSLEIGYVPALYEISREPINHHWAKWKTDTVRYTLNAGGSVKKEKYGWWNEIDLSQIWDRSDLQPSEGVLLLAWWNGKWGQVEAVRQLFEGYRATLKLPAADLAGRPVFIRWSKGRILPPTRYQKSSAGSAFADVQTAKARPEAFDANKTDTLGLTVAHYLGSWGLTGGFAELEPDSLKKLNHAKSAPTPLMLAAMHGHAETAERLTQLGLKMDAEMNKMGFDAGHLAVFAGHSNVIETFLGIGYPRRSKTGSGAYNPITLAIDTGRDDIVGLFDGSPRDLPSFSRTNRQHLLIREAARGNANSVRLLIEDGAKPNQLFDDRSALCFATRSGNTAAVETLLELGADPNLDEKVSPLQIATAFGDFESVTALLTAGADPNAERTPTPLQNAVVSGNARVVHALLEAGASPNPKMEGSRLGLAELATLTNQASVVADLFAAGAVCKLDVEQAETVLSHAIGNDIVEMAALAFDQCVAPDFALFGEYPMSWVADYFEAEGIRQWLASAHLSSDIADPVFTIAGALDARPKIVAGSLFPFTEDMFQRYGRIETKIRMVIDETGHVRFPKVDKSLPAKLRLYIYEAIAGWQFNPPTEDGKPVKTQVVLPLSFDLPPQDMGTLEMKDLTTPPQPISQSKPRYPAGLKMSGTEGMARLVFVVSKDGTVRSANVIRTTHPLLGLAAKQAVETWRFKPGTVDGKPVNTRVAINIPFSIN